MKNLRRIWGDVGFLSPKLLLEFFIYTDKNGQNEFVLVYVDDALIAGKTIKICQATKEML